MPNTIERAKGLYKNGSRWWMRVLGEPRSTGTTDLVLANRIAAMVVEMSDSIGVPREWIEKVAAGDVSLAELYAHRAAGTLHELKAKLDAAVAGERDPNIEPFVAKWASEHLPNVDISDRMRRTYVKQVRALIPEGHRFRASQFNEETLKKALRSLAKPRSGEPLTGSAKRRYVAAWRLFWRYVRKHVKGLDNPFDDADWLPANGAPRMRWWDHDTRLAVLAKLDGEAKVAMTLVLGSGMELGALYAMQGRHVNRDRTVVAPGTKNSYRRDRTIFVDRWAWDAVAEYAKGKRPSEPLFTIPEKALRLAFYEAQVAAGLIEQPTDKDGAGKWRWKLVDPHTIHDCRHTYCINRLLGMDGEPRQSLKFCAMQLGHADEQMVMKIYSKANIDERLRMIELAEARRAA